MTKHITLWVIKTLLHVSVQASPHHRKLWFKYSATIPCWPGMEHYPKNTLQFCRMEKLQFYMKSVIFCTSDNWPIKSSWFHTIVLPETRVLCCMRNPKLAEERIDLAVCNRFHTLQLPRAGYASSLVMFQTHRPPPLSQMTEQPKRT